MRLLLVEGDRLLVDGLSSQLSKKRDSASTRPTRPKGTILGQQEDYIGLLFLILVYPMVTDWTS